MSTTEYEVNLDLAIANLTEQYEYQEKLLRVKMNTLLSIRAGEGSAKFLITTESLTGNEKFVSVKARSKHLRRAVSMAARYHRKRNTTESYDDVVWRLFCELKHGKTKIVAKMMPDELAKIVPGGTAGIELFNMLQGRNSAAESAA